MNWGKAIFEIREKAGLRQSDLADAIGMTRASISNIETGRCVPGQDTLEKIAAALNIEVPLIELLATCMGPMNLATRDIMDQIIPAGKTKICHGYRKHWWLKNHLNEIEVLSYDFPGYYREILKRRGLPIDANKDSKLLVEWNKMPANYSFFYDYEDCEVPIEQDLASSLISLEQELIMDFGYNGPIIRLDTKLFIRKWYDFVRAVFFEACVFAENQNACSLFVFWLWNLRMGVTFYILTL